MDYDSDQNAADGAAGQEDNADMSEMQRLLDEQGASFKDIKRGDVVEGQIVRIDPEEILVDIGLKSEGVLSTKELPPQGYGSLSELNVGDEVLVYVMQPETPEGHAVVSIKRARLERQWRIAQEEYERGELLEADVIDHNKGGLIVNLEGIRGFVPISQILNLKREDSADNAETQAKLQTMVGRRLQLKIIEINRNRNRLILSERLAVQEWRQRRREELLNELQVGEVRKGVVSNLANFGAFVDLGGADGLVHISQLAWSRVNHPSEVLKVGQEVEVQVLSVDKDKKKIALSIKRAEVDPWTTVEQRYQPGQLVRGTITKIAPFGAFARIEDGIEGLIHLSELPAGTQDPKQALHEGQEVTVRVLRIDAERRRLGLSVRQAQEAPEAAAQEGAAEAAAPVGAEAPAPTAPAPAAGRRAPEPEEPQTAIAAAFRAAQAAQSNQSRELVNGGPSQATRTLAAEPRNGQAQPMTVEEPAGEAPDATQADITEATQVELPAPEAAPAAEGSKTEVSQPEAAPAGTPTAEALSAAEAPPAETPKTRASKTKAAAAEAATVETPAVEAASAKAPQDETSAPAEAQARAPSPDEAALQAEPPAGAESQVGAQAGETAQPAATSPAASATETPTEEGEPAQTSRPKEKPRAPTTETAAPEEPITGDSSDVSQAVTAVTPGSDATAPGSGTTTQA